MKYTNYRTTLKNEIVSAVAATLVVGGLFTAYYLCLADKIEAHKERSHINQLENSLND